MTHYHLYPFTDLTDRLTSKTIISSAVFMTMMMVGTQQAYADEDKTNDEMALYAACTQVKLDAARLACFDKIANKGGLPNFINAKQPIDLAKTFKSTIKGTPQVVLANENQPESEQPMANSTNDIALLGQTEETKTTQPNTQTLNTQIPNDNLTDDKMALVKQTKNDNSSHDTQTAAQYGLNEILSVHPSQSDDNILKTVGVNQTDVGKYTPLSLAYDLDKNSELGTWTARPYRPMYILPIYYNFNPNRDPKTPTQETVNYTSRQMLVPELKFQASLKTKVAEDLFGTNADLWFGYTQQSHWQVYNGRNSRPFRATDYEPELFVTQPVTANLPFGGRLRMLGAGALHHSNGQSDPLSRSWNRVYLMGGAEWDKLTVIPRVWAHVTAKVDDKPSDNPDITDYMGYGDVKFSYDLSKGQNVSGTLRYNPSTNKGGVELGYIVPVKDNINGYIRFFHGYGESIIDYNHKDTTLGFGIVLNDWKGL